MDKMVCPNYSWQSMGIPREVVPMLLPKSTSKTLVNILFVVKSSQISSFIEISRFTIWYVNYIIVS